MKKNWQKYLSKLKLLFGLSLLVFIFSACSGMGVKPWQRGNLAKPIMEMGYDPLEAGLEDHTYFSKEATSGGRGFAGGGCGCN